MSLKERLATPPSSKNPLEAWFAGLSADDQEAVVPAARDKAWKGVDLFALLKDEGAPLKDEGEDDPAKTAIRTFHEWRKRIARSNP